MPKLPSFTALFLIGTLGFALYMGATIWSFENIGRLPGWLSQVLGIAQLVGLGMVVVAPFLMLLKFFRRLDQKS
ncbi:hypothetical protein K3G63_09515 [Hymenobacter sp. HSC-4F20]|uniref:hypothetical protein n=1 Tax=Hymenobacter sp. HSC-4F20 TaxID=2864135 RepID=UPI001C735DD2|nr:hypothetical protein [Hymenobacter sp. HSC-4F20]MBX0290675.1 hypothetical protein [Hymenobacter sp. HSC-4F20]